MDKNYFSYMGTGKYQSAVHPAVATALAEFCEQEPEFEQAIIQSGKSFKDCLDAICQRISDHISDLELYERAVKFYFPVAAVRFRMEIDLCGDNGAVDPPITMHKPAEQMSLSLDSLLDF